MKKTKKILSLIISVIMVISMVPTYTMTAFADDPCDHQFINVNVDAGCETNGIKLENSDDTGFCELCGKFYVDGEEKTIDELAADPATQDPAKGHALADVADANGSIDHEWVEANANADGNVVVSGNVIARVKEKATCTETGEIACMRENSILTAYQKDDDSWGITVETKTCDEISCAKTYAITALGHDLARDADSSTVYTEGTEDYCEKDDVDVMACQRDGCSYTEDQTARTHTGHVESALRTVELTYPTCTQPGVNGAKETVCLVCGKQMSYIDGQQIPALGHVWSEYVSNEDATCLEDGTKTRTCQRDGCNATETVDDEGSALGHAYGEYVSDGNATCTQDGTKTATCANDATHTDTVTDEGSALGHAYGDYVSDGNATCTQDGTKTATCANDATHTDTVTDEGSALGHSFTNYVSNNDSTCVDLGTKTATCDRDGCDATDTIDGEIDPDNHDWSEWDLDPDNEEQEIRTCQRIGCTAVEERNHPSFTADVTEPTCTDQGYTTYVCDNCGYTYVADYTDPTGHSFTDYESNGDATCTEDGTETAECDNDCGETDTRTEEGSALGHSFTNYVSNNDATCTEDGTETAECDNDCGETDTRTEEGSALGHNYDEGVVTTPPTCILAGEKTFTCQNDASHTYTEEVEALGHVELPAVVENYVQQTCTEAGSYDSVVYCERCGAEVSRDTITINAAGHVWAPVEEVPATCEVAGTTAHNACENCDATEGMETIAPLGHDYDEGVVTTPPTCLLAGERTFTCQNDASHTYTEEVEALGHNTVVDEVESARWEPTCTEPGRRYFVCDRCGQNKFYEVIPALGHLPVQTAAGVNIYRELANCQHGNKYTCRRRVYERYPDGSKVKNAEGEFNYVGRCGEVSGEEIDEETTNSNIAFRAPYRDTLVNKEDTNALTLLPAEVEDAATLVYFTTSTPSAANLFDYTVALNEDGDGYELATGHADAVYSNFFGVYFVTGHFQLTAEVAATCDFNRYAVYTCSECGESVVLVYANTAIGHDWMLMDDHYNVKPTCTDEGRRLWMCRNDNTHQYEEVLAPYGHQFELNPEMSVAPTCGVDGYDYYECVNSKLHEDNTCNETFTEVVKATGEHMFSTKRVAATCTTEGYIKYTCDVCGYSFKETTTDKMGHHYIEVASEFVDSTCYAKGKRVFACDREGCDATYESPIAQKAHNYGKKEVVPATCTANGYTKYSCTNPGCTEFYETEKTDKVPHVYNTVSTVNATCTQDGKVTSTCINCGYNKIDVLPATGHNYGKVEVTEATCTTSGSTKYSCTNDGCNESYVSDITDIAEHVIKSLSTDKATCTQDGKETLACANCDYKFIKVLPATGHNYGKKEVVEATCTTTGYTKYTCTNDGCAANYVTDETDKVAHVYNTVETVNATCTTDGKVTSTCANCGYKKIDVLPATGHNYGKVEVTEASCTTSGSTKYTCTNDGCGVSYVSDYTDLADHVFNTVETENATCTADGKVTSTCANCGYKKVEVLPATGHNYGKSEITKKATCTEDGEITFSCTNDGCTATYVDVIPATGHNYSKTEVTEATCTTDGFTTYSCTNDGCTASYVTDKTSKINHVMKVTASVDATCTKDGGVTYTCVNCDYTYTEQIQAKGHIYDTDGKRTPATCQDYGYLTMTCSRCGLESVTIDEDMLAAHVFKDTVTTKAGTSTVGIITTECIHCHKVLKNTIARIAKIELSTTVYNYNGKACRPAVKVYDAKGNKLRSGKDYTVEFKNNTAIGTATAKIKFIGNYAGTANKTFKIQPQNVGSSNIVTKNKTITYTWGRVKNCDGYEIQVATNADFKNATKKTIKSNKTCTYKATNLKKGKKYFFRVRCFKMVNGKKVYGNWTVVSKVCK